MSVEAAELGVRSGGGTRYGYFVVCVLMTIYLLAFVDRVIIGLMIDPIRADLALNDTQIGLLVGFGFILLYSVLGLPFGIVADRGNRRNLIFAGLLTWSVATVMCGFATSFGLLFAARALVGVGEASLAPAAYSTIADRIPRERLGFAMGLYSLGVSLGAGAAMMLGGLLIKAAHASAWRLPGGLSIGGWRAAFLAVGLMGLPIAAMLLLTVREASRHSRGATNPSPAVLKYLSENRAAFAGLFAGSAAMVGAAYLPLIWAPAYFTRVHMMPIQHVGLALGLMIAIGGTAGLLLGGAVSDHLLRRGYNDAPLRVILWSHILQIPVFLLSYLSTSRSVALAAFAVGVFLSLTMGGLQGAMLRALTPAAMRGRVTSIYMLCVTVTGLGLAPLSVGILNDRFFGGAGIGKSLAAVSVTGLVLTVFFLWIARKPMRRLISAVSTSERVSGGMSL